MAFYPSVAVGDGVFALIFCFLLRVMMNTYHLNPFHINCFSYE